MIGRCPTFRRRSFPDYIGDDAGEVLQTLRNRAAVIDLILGSTVKALACGAMTS